MKRRFSVVAAFGWACGVTVALQGVLALLYGFFPSVTIDLVTLGSVSALVYGFAIFLIYSLYARDRSWTAALGVRIADPTLIVLGLLLGIALHAPADSLQGLVEWAAGPTPEQQVAHRALLMRAEDQLDAAMMMLSTACLVPLVEEFLFRGVIFGALVRNLSALMAALVTGALFVVVHTETRIWLPLCVVATVLSVLRVISGSVLPGFALHLAFNAVTLTLMIERLVPVDQRLGLSWQLSVTG